MKFITRWSSSQTNVNGVSDVGLLCPVTRILWLSEKRHWFIYSLFVIVALAQLKPQAGIAPIPAAMPVSVGNPVKRIFCLCIFWLVIRLIRSLQ